MIKINNIPAAFDLSLARAKLLCGSMGLRLSGTTHYVGALQLMQEALTFLTTPRATRSIAAVKFCIRNCRKEYGEFLKRNINFYEANYKPCNRLDNNLRFADNAIERLEEYLVDPDKLLPPWCSPRRPDLQKEQGRLNKDFSEMVVQLKKVQSAFNQHLQECQKNKQHPNDPIVRINLCLAEAARQTTRTEAGIHQFNWARHIKSIAVSYQYESGYKFKPFKQLRQLEGTMRIAERLFFKIKDNVDRINDLNRADTDMAKFGYQCKLDKETIAKLLPRLEVRIARDIERLRQYFTTARLPQEFTCKLLAPPVHAGYMNSNLSSSWLLERDSPQRQAANLYEGVARNSHARRGSCSSDFVRIAPAARTPTRGRGRPNSSYTSSSASSSRQTSRDSMTLDAGTAMAIGVGLGGGMGD